MIALIVHERERTSMASSSRLCKYQFNASAAREFSGEGKLNVVGYALKLPRSSNL
jgi:hypothetical protein